MKRLVRATVAVVCLAALTASPAVAQPAGGVAGGPGRVAPDAIYPLCKYFAMFC